MGSLTRCVLGRLIMVVAVAAAVVTGLAGCTDSVAPSGSGVSETGQVESGGVSASASVSASVSAEREEAAALLAADRLPLPEGWSADDPNLVVMSTEQAREVVEGADYQMVRIYNDTAVRPDGCLMSPNQTTLQADGSIGGMCLQAEAEDPTKTPKNRLFWNNSQGEVQFFQAPKGLPVDTIERGSGLTDARGSLVGGVDYTSDNWFVDDWRLFTVDLRTGKSRSVVDWTEICDSRYVAAMSGRETVARLGETKMFFSTHEPAKPGGRCDPEVASWDDVALFARDLDGKGPITKLADQALAHAVVGDTAYYRVEESPYHKDGEITRAEVRMVDPAGVDSLVAAMSLPNAYSFGAVAASEFGVAWVVQRQTNCEHDYDPADCKGEGPQNDARIYALANDGRKFVIYRQSAHNWDLHLKGSRLAWSSTGDITDEDGELVLALDHGQYIADLKDAAIIRFPECDDGCGETVIANGDYAVFATSRPEDDTPASWDKMTIIANLVRLKPDVFIRHKLN